MSVGNQVRCSNVDESPRCQGKEQADDRLIHVPDEKKLTPGKRVFLVLPYGREDKDLFIHVAKQTGQTFKYVLGAKVSSLMVPGVMDAGKVLDHEELMQQAYDIGAGFAAS